MQQLAIQIHIIFILIALGISPFILLRRKGDLLHRILGRCFWACMFITATSTFWIKSFGGYSFIHLLSIATLCWLITAVIATRFKFKNWLYIHAISMGSVFIAIPIAGAGVLVRHYILPGNAAAGGYASVMIALIAIPLLLKLTKRYR